MGLEQQQPEVDVEALTERIESIKMRLQRSTTSLLDQPGRRRWCTARPASVGPNEVEITTVDATARHGAHVQADAVLIATGSRPRIPDWCQPDGERILTTRDCYPPKMFPESVTVVGSGVTGVEFVHMFSSFGAKVTLVVSRQQVLPSKDPEVAAVLEDDFLERGVQPAEGRPGHRDRPRAGDRDGVDEVVVRCDDGRVVRSSHAVLAIGSVPNTDGLGLEAAGVEIDARRLRHHQPPLPEQRRRTSTPPAT